MSNQMKALAKTKADKGLEMIEAPVPEIGPDDVLIKVNKTGICGTDIHIWEWDDWASATVPVPLITGHEFAGEIVDMGRNVDGLSIGQRVTIRGEQSEATTDASDPQILFDATQGVVRMHVTHLSGVVNTITPGQTDITLHAIDRRRADIFDFTGTGG